MPVTELPAAGSPDPDHRGPGGPDHPMRRVTLDTAFDPGSWTPERAAKVADLFDGMAAEWHTRRSGDREDVLIDALTRSGPLPSGPCLELGSGSGLVTAEIARQVGSTVIALDLARQMLAHSPPDAGPRVQADAQHLPVPPASVAVLVLQNMFLFPAEVDRVLRPDGVLVWVNSSGEYTPIHLTADEVDRALPGEWDVIASRHGNGTWAVARRADHHRGDV